MIQSVFTYGSIALLECLSINLTYEFIHTYPPGEVLLSGGRDSDDTPTQAEVVLQLPYTDLMKKVPAPARVSSSPGPVLMEFPLCANAGGQACQRPSGISRTSMVTKTVVFRQ